MPDQQTLYERLQAAEAKLVASLGMETAIIAIENIDKDFYQKDFFLIEVVTELIRKQFPFPGKISGPISSSRQMANAKRAFAHICITQMGLKKRQVATILHSGLRNIYNLYNDANAMLADNGNNNFFKQRYNIVLYDFKKFMKNYERTKNT